MPAGYAEPTKMVFSQATWARDNLFMIDLSKTPRLIAEWQQHGPETLSGHAAAKLRLSFGPTQPVTT
jgi:hypothetical protein